MRPETSELSGVGEWEDAAPSNALAAITEATGAVPDATIELGDRMSLIHAAVRLQLDGFNATEVAALLSVPYSQVYRALRDPRAMVVRQRLAADKTGLDVLAAAQAKFRLDRAWEVVGASMESSDKWLRFQAAGLVIAADRAAKEKGAQEITVRMAPELCFDDQDLQEDDAEDAYMEENGDGSTPTGENECI